MSKVKVVPILLVTASLLKQYILPQLSCCTKVTLGLRQAGSINPNTAELESHTNLTETFPQAFMATSPQAHP